VAGGAKRKVGRKGQAIWAVKRKKPEEGKTATRRRRASIAKFNTRNRTAERRELGERLAGDLRRLNQDGPERHRLP